MSMKEMQEKLNTIEAKLSSGISPRKIKELHALAIMLDNELNELKRLMEEEKNAKTKPAFSS